jgi:farnesyl diphosphate synthase
MSVYSSETSDNAYLQLVLSDFKAVLDYNIVGGKKLRPTLVIDTIRTISSQTDPSIFTLLLKHAAILGWCIELMHGASLVADDLMDHSLTRRGKPCWYLQTNEKEEAVNDSFYLVSGAYILLYKYFPTNHTLHHYVTEGFHRTVIGEGKMLFA